MASRQKVNYWRSFVIHHIRSHYPAHQMNWPYNFIPTAIAVIWDSKFIIRLSTEFRAAVEHSQLRPVMAFTGFYLSCNESIIHGKQLWQFYIFCFIQGEITSANRDGLYMRNIDCRYLIKIPMDSKMTITFSLFKLEGGTECSFDYLEVYDDLF